MAKRNKKLEPAHIPAKDGSRTILEQEEITRFAKSVIAQEATNKARVLLIKRQFNLTRNKATEYLRRAEARLKSDGDAAVAIHRDQILRDLSQLALKAEADGDWSSAIAANREKVNLIKQLDSENKANDLGTPEMMNGIQLGLTLISFVKELKDGGYGYDKDQTVIDV